MIGGIDWLIRGTHIYNYTPACPACLPVGIISHLYHTPVIYNITVNTSCSELLADRQGGRLGAGGVRELVLPW